MSSATGVPDGRPNRDAENSLAESEPLLGRPGDVLQKPDESIFHNLFSGTAWLAQFGVVLLVALTWSAIFTHPPLIPLFSPHPLLQTAGVVALVEAILILQPTWTAAEKATGARAHAALQLASFLLFAAGVLLIEANKIRQGPASHFHSVHGYLGVAASVVLAAQYLVGLAMWAAPALLGGEERAKSVWKYHRMSGYLLLALLAATVVSAVWTDFNKNVLHIRAWAVIVAVGLVVAGVYPRVHLRKFGFSLGRNRE